MAAGFNQWLNILISLIVWLLKPGSTLQAHIHLGYC